MGVVNTFVNSEPGDADGAAEETYRGTALSGSEKVGAGRGTRTHTPVKVADLSLIGLCLWSSAYVHSAANQKPCPRGPPTHGRA